MYCVKCGVKLAEGEKVCPLCGTPLWDPDGICEKTGGDKNYPDNMPRHYNDLNIPALFFITALSVITIIVEIGLCLKLYGGIAWSGYVAGGVALFYITFVLPRWFRRPKAVIFVPVAHAAAMLYVLYICLKTGGKWFLPFAFPVIGISALASTAMICMIKYIRKGRVFIFGGFLIFLGGFTLLLEFFMHIAFGTPMFNWSLFTMAGLGSAGLLLLIAGTIKPLRRAIEKVFFF